jgi:hypothetical protein
MSSEPAKLTKSFRLMLSLDAESTSSFFHQYFCFNSSNRGEVLISPSLDGSLAISASIGSARFASSGCEDL